MKKIIYISGITLVMLLFSNLLLAQSKTDDTLKVKQETIKSTSQIQRGQNFIDENKNGVCDRFENAKPLGRGPNFVDADKNGVCDHRENSNKGNGNGYQHRHGKGNGQCCGRGPCGGKGWKKR